MPRLSCIGGASGGTASRTIGGGEPHPETPASRIGMGFCALGVWAGRIQPRPKGTPCNPRRTSQPAPPAGARPIARRPSSDGWPSWSSRVVDRRRRRARGQLTDAEAVSGEAGRAEVALEKVEPDAATARSSWSRATSRTADDPAFEAAVAEATRSAARRAARCAEVSSPADGGGQVSADGHSALVEFQIPGDDEQAEEKVDASLAATAAAQRRHPDLRVEQFGDASANKALEAVFNDDLKQGRRRPRCRSPWSILLLAFGALVAALVPLLLAFSAVLATIGLLALPSQLVPMDPNVSAVVVLVGLAVGVDYSLFYLRREREERRKGRSRVGGAGCRGGDLGPGGAGLRR